MALAAPLHSRRRERWSTGRFYFLELSDGRREIKRPLFFGRKAKTNLDSVLKSRDITLPTKVYIVRAMVFPVVMYGCETWTMRKAEHRRTDAFKLWGEEDSWRVSWMPSRSNQSDLKEINPECSLEGLMLRLQLQQFGHLMRGADTLGKILMLEKVEGRWRRG